MSPQHLPDEYRADAERLRALLAEQRVSGVLVGGFFGALVSALTWLVMSRMSPAASGLMVALSGPLVGWIVGYFGRGIETRFRFAAVLIYLAVPTIAANVGAHMHLSRPVPTVVLLGIYATGLYFAWSLSARSMTNRQLFLNRRYRSEVAPSGWRTSWLVVMLSAALAVVSAFVTALVLSELSGTTRYWADAQERAAYDPVARGTQVGTNLGQYLNPEECERGADEHVRACGDHSECVAARPYVAAACVQAATTRLADPAPIP